MGETVEALVDAGKASAGPPLGPALGPSGVNVKQVIEEINSLTKEMEGMQVPVKVKVGDDKSFSITVGTPPASSLIKQVLGIKKGSGEAGTVVAAELPLEKAIKVAKQKGPGLTGGDIKAMTSEILGVAKSMGLSCENKDPKEIQASIKSGDLDDRF
ncbi:MAG: 50S ribosomal protein L11 [Marine Group III euryarchaeote CG-Epi2]|jgi:large subunit ribosomal protein L11|uniref:Large ribosomal subunit protein uL11 n=1 Tax=Marine Group III euryarchaeote CG-Epi2 TaxID=1888996 RepID=A0A1J5U9L2_9ARCH|nr:MAG: 50S ribosomal protein L11 [Marine Group III euryarchaeote CG-Epi2]OIR22620.1 MAG: 50S ribosomal protein L11 [Marine Group III euryarchaeote CG-Epi2]|tara:strand:+ start:1204 stop:1674 length:471 start_codon:yes stop_codon:yes gene_type:complete